MLICAAERHATPTAKATVNIRTCTQCAEPIQERKWRTRRLLCQRCWHKRLADLFLLFRIGLELEEVERETRLSFRSITRYYRMYLRGCVEGKFSPDTRRVLEKLVHRSSPNQAPAQLYSEQMFRRAQDTLPLPNSRQRKHLFTRLRKSRSSQERYALQKKLTKINLRLIVWVIEKYHTLLLPLTSLEFLDLFQEGYLGLRRAVKKYDYQRGYRGFTTYAITAITRAASRYITQSGWTYNLPASFFPKVLALAEGIEYQSEDLPTRNAQSTVLRAPMQLTVLAHEDIPHIVQKDDETDLSAPAIDQKLTEQQLGEALSDALDSVLLAREAAILRWHYGLTSENKTRTLSEIGALLSLTRERVRQIEVKAFEKLRASEFAPILSSFLYP